MRGNPCLRCDEWWTADTAEVSPGRAMALIQGEEPESPRVHGDHRESDGYENAAAVPPDRGIPDVNPAPQ